jgi:hypothetical protein
MAISCPTFRINQPNWPRLKLLGDPAKPCSPQEYQLDIYWLLLIYIVLFAHPATTISITISARL